MIPHLAIKDTISETLKKNSCIKLHDNFLNGDGDVLSVQHKKVNLQHIKSEKSPKLLFTESEEQPISQTKLSHLNHCMYIYIDTHTNKFPKVQIWDHKYAMVLGAKLHVSKSDNEL